MQTTDQRVKKIIAEQLGTEQESISSSMTMACDLDADSLDIIEIVMALEDEFDIEIPDHHVDDVKTVQDLLSLVERLQAA